VISPQPLATKFKDHSRLYTLLRPGVNEFPRGFDVGLSEARRDISDALLSSYYRAGLRTIRHCFWPENWVSNERGSVLFNDRLDVYADTVARSVKAGFFVLCEPFARQDKGYIANLDLTQDTPGGYNADWYASCYEALRRALRKRGVDDPFRVAIGMPNEDGDGPYQLKVTYAQRNRELLKLFRYVRDIYGRRFLMTWKPYPYAALTQFEGLELPEDNNFVTAINYYGIFMLWYMSGQPGFDMIRNVLPYPCTRPEAEDAIARLTLESLKPSSDDEAELARRNIENLRVWLGWDEYRLDWNLDGHRAAAGLATAFTKATGVPVFLTETGYGGPTVSGDDPTFTAVSEPQYRRWVSDAVRAFNERGIGALGWLGWHFARNRSIGAPELIEGRVAALRGSYVEPSAIAPSS
jgi:hypothetical protein